MPNEIPAVSVIVPMYNVEKYIGELLDSVLNQTLTNFELIIVNNGSTDCSRKIVETYIQKFGGRLSLIDLPVNTGNPSEPRNKGLIFSRGKYVFFADSDDILINNALEQMYVVAESCQADVVYCENYGISYGAGKDFLKNVQIRENLLVKEPTLISDDLSTRISYYLKFCFEAPPWLKLSRRDFLISNDIIFPEIHHEDNLWTFKLLCLAKRFAVMPNTCYINRKREGSESAKRSEFSKQLRYFMERTVIGMRALDSFMAGLDFFKSHANFRYAMLNFYTTIDLKQTMQLFDNSPPHVIFESFRDVFDTEMGKNSALISYLVTNNIMLARDLIIANQKISDASAGDSFNLGTK